MMRCARGLIHAPMSNSCFPGRKKWYIFPKSLCALGDLGYTEFGTKRWELEATNFKVGPNKHQTAPFSQGGLMRAWRKPFHGIDVARRQIHGDVETGSGTPLIFRCRCAQTGGSRWGTWRSALRCQPQTAGSGAPLRPQTIANSGGACISRLLWRCPLQVLAPPIQIIQYLVIGSNRDLSLFLVISS